MPAIRPSTDGVTRRQALIGGLAATGSALRPDRAEAAYVVRPWAAGKPVPSLDLTDLSGKTWSLSALRGQVVLMNFWATWCEPCRAEMPSLDLLAQRHRADGVQVLAINYKESVPVIRRYLERQPLSLPILLDSDGDATSAWTPRVFPTTVLVDRGGQPRHVVVGEVDWSGSVARDLIDPLIARTRTS